ncbi:methylamine utilization protein [Alteromonas sp. ZYF713]|nr:methylamine utilization protein [Alteromonas sp. ZYF713]
MNHVDKAFEPSVLTIQKGQMVAFPNGDDIRHQVYCLSSPKPSEINLYSGINTTPIEFEQHGIVVLGCNIRDDMVGYINIADDEALWQSDKHGEVTLQSEIERAMVRHPDLDVYHTERESLLIQEATVSQIVTLELMSFLQSQGRRTFGSGKFGHV